MGTGCRLVVEVDGKYRSHRVSADARRDRVLHRLGYRVLRLDAELVRCNLVEAVGQVRVALAQAQLPEANTRCWATPFLGGMNRA